MCSEPFKLTSFYLVLLHTYHPHLQTRFKSHLCSVIPDHHFNAISVLQKSNIFFMRKYKKDTIRDKELQYHCWGSVSNLQLTSVKIEFICRNLRFFQYVNWAVCNISNTNKCVIWCSKPLDSQLLYSYRTVCSHSEW